MFDYRKDNLFIKAIIHELGHLIVGYIHGIVNTNNLIKLYVKADADRIDGHIIISDNYDCSDEEYVRFKIAGRVSEYICGYKKSKTLAYGTDRDYVMYSTNNDKVLIRQYFNETIQLLTPYKEAILAMKDCILNSKVQCDETKYSVLAYISNKECLQWLEKHITKE